MPANPQWYHRLPEIKLAISAAKIRLLDRAAVETFFNVSRRQAIRILARFGRPQHGKEQRVLTERVLAWLDELERGDGFATDRERRRRVREAVLEARTMVEARKVSFRPVPSPTERPTIKNLPAGVEIAPGELRVTFDEPQALLEKLFALSKAIAADFLTFEAIARPGERAAAERLRMGYSRR
jgi:hypothetical protein